MKKLYRYAEDKSFEFWGQAEDLHLSEYPVIKETGKGNWILLHDKRKFCLNGEGKRFAHETKELALKYFIARKKRQYEINKSLMKQAKYYLEIAERMTTPQTNESFKN